MAEQKSSGIAVILSFLIPGLGQIYNGQIGKGILFIFLSIVFGLMSIILIGIPLYLILWVYGMYDAYRIAEATNSNTNSKKQISKNEPEPLKTLKLRYANGEITKKQYETKKRILEET
ncbi:MAG: SHOCT domain-containing protein [Candidatus Micrarchaeota archaeon]|nr:SHOCT domain-containing protein [Candidatus Micrarchaeota archaeon]MDE1848111.1 SHOCT domain-containing protein [Candidatus Micrarchaeota archaeon]MDE1863918.1 SHOCT domain-containing protein [Candidatus Micrarchaeota archaeon]